MDGLDDGGPARAPLAPRQTCGSQSPSSLPIPHSLPLQVHYTFNKVLMLQEPLLVVAAFYILFFTVIIYVRLDFSITKVPTPWPFAYVFG